MKIYEKPMAKIEMLNIEDGITVSPVEADKDTYANAYADLKQSTHATNTIIFEW